MFYVVMTPDRKFIRAGMKLTPAQFKALWAAFEENGAIYTRGGHMGGAKRRMCERMAKDFLVSPNPPFPITLKGMHALREACYQRWAKSGCMAHQDDLKEVEAALRS